MMEDTDRQINPGDSGNLRSFEVADKQKVQADCRKKENFIETRKGIVHFAELSLEEQKGTDSEKIQRMDRSSVAVKP